MKFKTLSPERQKQAMKDYLKTHSGLLKMIFVLDNHDLRLMMRECGVSNWSVMSKHMMINKVIELDYPLDLYPRENYTKGMSIENWAAMCYIEDVRDYNLRFNKDEQSTSGILSSNQRPW